MCFIKSSSPSVPAVAEPEPVVRHQADASATKTSKTQSASGYEQNIKTSAVGLTDTANTEKKTLLGE